MVLRGTQIQRSGPAGFTLRVILVPPDHIVPVARHGAPIVYSCTDTYRLDPLRITRRDNALLKPDRVRELTRRRMV